MRFDIDRPKSRRFEDLTDSSIDRFFTLRKIKGEKWRVKSSYSNVVYTNDEINIMKKSKKWRETS